jgi:hypothetical protein
MIRVPGELISPDALFEVSYPHLICYSRLCLM